MPFKSRMRSRANKLGRAASMSGENIHWTKMKNETNCYLPKLQIVEHANRRFHSLVDLSRPRSSDKSWAESVHYS
jgi:hypothetical protein